MYVYECETIHVYTCECKTTYLYECKAIYIIYTIYVDLYTVGCKIICVHGYTCVWISKYIHTCMYMYKYVIATSVYGPILLKHASCYSAILSSLYLHRPWHLTILSHQKTHWWSQNCIMVRKNAVADIITKLWNVSFLSYHIPRYATPYAQD